MTDDLEPPQTNRLTEDGQWRAEYRKLQQERRIAGVQPDMFGGPAVVYRRENSPVGGTPENRTERDQGLSKMRAKTTREPLTNEEKSALIASAANWLRLGQRVRIVGSAASVDGRSERNVGRSGVVWRLCSPVFSDYTYVYLDPTKRERSEKIVFVELRDIEPLG